MNDTEWILRPIEVQGTMTVQYNRNLCGYQEAHVAIRSAWVSDISMRTRVDVRQIVWRYHGKKVGE